MVFVRGAWLEPWHDIFPWEPKWDEYFCCPSHHLKMESHHETFDPSTGKGEKHDPMCWITCHCNILNQREIPTTEESFARHAIIRPLWCPLR